MAPTPTTDELRKALADLASGHAEALGIIESQAPMLALAVGNVLTKAHRGFDEALAAVEVLEISSESLASIDLDLMGELDRLDREREAWA